RLVEEPRVVAGRDSAVAGANARAERVCGDVKPAGLKVETDRLGSASRKSSLGVDRKLALQNLPPRLPFRLSNRRDQWHQLGGQSCKYLANLRGSHPRLVLVEKRIVRMLLVTDRVSLAALEIDDLLQPGLERGEVAFRPRFLPDLLRSRRDTSHLL